MENIPRAAFITVLRFYIVSVRNPLDTNIEMNQFWGALVLFVKLLLSWYFCADEGINSFYLKSVHGKVNLYIMLKCILLENSAVE